MNAKQEEARQRRADMTTLEVRRGVGRPWLRVRDIAPEIVARVVPSSDGVVDERIILAWGLSAGGLEGGGPLFPGGALALPRRGGVPGPGGRPNTPPGGPS